MVTVRNDIEMIVAAVPPSTEATKVKDVNLRQNGKPVRHRKLHRCVIIVGVATVVLVLLAMGSVFLYEYLRDDPWKTITIRPSTTEKTVAEQSAPTFSDPFGGTPGQPEIELEPVDSDEIDIDGTPATTTSTTIEATTTPEEVQSSSDEGSGEDSDYQYGGSGSGSGGDDDMW